MIYSITESIHLKIFHKKFTVTDDVVVGGCCGLLLLLVVKLTIEMNNVASQMQETSLNNSWLLLTKRTLTFAVYWVGGQVIS